MYGIYLYITWSSWLWWTNRWPKNACQPSTWNCVPKHGHSLSYVDYDFYCRLKHFCKMETLKKLQKFVKYRWKFFRVLSYCGNSILFYSYQVKWLRSIWPTLFIVMVISRWLWFISFRSQWFNSRFSRWILRSSRPARFWSRKK
jgi:hypothetical protein